MTKRPFQKKKCRLPIKTYLVLLFGIFSIYQWPYNYIVVNKAVVHVLLLDNNKQSAEQIYQRKCSASSHVHRCTDCDAHGADKDSLFEMFYNQLEAFYRKVVAKYGHYIVSAKQMVIIKRAINAPFVFPYAEITTPCVEV